ncbi:NTP pyrophosphatase, house-cleaning of non-canonical NTPs [Lentzea albidocapillata subsp. violacea]|uniref:NTP pyrophosphatase, house-cleaning of non-canonical NTPs n=1 Tax=Lentzea albidocapillata subsp. violacea TaxID=128104 RepID=A0A1G9V336_9PSEU|nr:nucleotide pyrophosphohydrolase [Lentzea albidocapillata]SDM66661.1 NTP pyrophosphatase, house-cleaning of non-canonical NTPs [Lentzea albidocapillata subsp. violacea]
MSQRDLVDLRDALRAFAAARDWDSYHTPKNLVMALSAEVGELTDLFQWLTPEEAQDAMKDPELAWNVRDELADVMHYLTRLADKLGVDLVETAFAKIDRNERRFPSGSLIPVPVEKGEQ